VDGRGRWRRGEAGVRNRLAAATLSTCAAAIVALSPTQAASPPLAAPVVWRLDNLTSIGGHAVTSVGSPRVVQTDLGAVVEFDGASDGLYLDVNPIAGLEQFAIQVIFQPAADGGEEQRFLDVEEAGTGNRALVELRLRDGRWALDTYLRSGQSGLTLLDRARTHPPAGWHVATLTYDGTMMTHYVDGFREQSGAIAFVPLAGGRTSIGLREDRRSWFRGRIHSVRFVPWAETPTIPLWPEGVPGAKPDGGDERVEDGRVYNVQVPSLTIVPPAGAPNGTAVIVCPGGGYARLAIANEGEGVARRLQADGITTFILEYRLAEYGHPAPLQDVLRAVRLLRSRAPELGIRPDRIGVMGASAGGHVAASAATLFDAPEGRTGAALDATSARPDFVALLYPVITMAPPFAHEGSRRALLGAAPPDALVDRLSLDTQVRRDTPPVFLVHTAEDTSVPLENSLLFYQALRRAGVSAELHLFERGAHGFGTRDDLGPTSGWVDRWLEWMQAHGFIDAARRSTEWARGVEGQRKADLGNGYYLNPIVSGDHPDPSILKDGDDYYMTFSSFDAYPGLVIWHSRDLVNWQPIGPALFKNVGSVWAPDLVKHRGRYYIYFPGIGPNRSTYVVWADDIRGPWSDPIDLKNRRIDPGHAVGPDGTRYLFLSGGYVVTLADDGLSIAGNEKHVYSGWQYPKDWIVEGFAQEGPKILRRGDYYYQVLAEGGTAGPPTGHMIVAARAKNLAGPWENSPYNPIVRTASSAERWWSRGHGTLVEGPDRRWWIVYHAYENGFYNLGRQTLLEPVEWLDDGWFRVTTHDQSKPIQKPVPASTGPHGFAFSDDFSTNKMGVQWGFYKGDVTDRDRYRYERNALVLRAQGTSPADCQPLSFVTGDHAYEIEVEIDADERATAGLLLFYNRRLYVGLGFSTSSLIMHSYGTERPGAKPAALGNHVYLRLRNDRHIVTVDYSADGRTWQRYDRGMEVSGYHHNVGYDFLSLRPAVYAAGTGEVRFSQFTYRALP
jgi:xylan 1,4-beta-xylosidase